MSTISVQPPPQTAARVTHPDPRQRDFAVRFTPSSGVLPLLRRPSNSFQWVGVGALRIDDRGGVHVSAKRLTLLGLRRTRRFIRPADIRNVYREGNSVQIDLRDAPASRRSGAIPSAVGPFVQFWTDNAVSAAQIVSLLPTTYTVELETSLPVRERSGRTAAPGVGVLLWSALALVAAAWFGTMWLRSTREPAPPSVSAGRGDVKAGRGESLDGDAQPSSAVRHLGSVPLAAGDLAGASQTDMLQARDDLRSFSERFEGLTTQFATAFDALQAGKLSQQEFGEGLEKWLLPQWRTLSAELRSHAAEPGSARARADVQLDAVMDSWQRALTAYAHGLRVHDPREVLGAFAYIGDAEEHQRRVQAQTAELQRELPPASR